MLSCLGWGKASSEDERRPLLPQYNDDTALQTRLHEKLHTYQMLRAISHGYMPSNEQVIIHMRSLLSADVLNPETSDLSPSGRALVQTTRLWVQQFSELLKDKNSGDQIQDFIWYLTKARLDVDASDLTARVSTAKAKADTKATYRSLQTVGSLLLNNSDFRVFLSDLGTIGKEVFRDTAFALADVSSKAGEQLEPSQEEQEALTQQNGKADDAPTKKDLQDEVRDVAQVVTGGVADVATEATHSVSERVGSEEEAALVNRLKNAVSYLRRRPDYSESVSTLSLLLQRYLITYSHAATDTLEAVEEDVHTNAEADRAVRNFWQLITSFGDREAWASVQKAFGSVVQDGQPDPKFDEFVRQLANYLQDMLSEPDFFDNIGERFDALRKKSRELMARSSIAEDVDTLFTSLQTALISIKEDAKINKLLRTTRRLAHLLSPKGQYINNQLATDSINVFGPQVLQAIQYIPIPRLEVSTPAIDLLLENLILEPGRTINQSSFLPYKLRASTYNDIEVRKARFGTTSTITSVVTIKLAGLSLAAVDLGYWTKLHAGLLRFTDEGLAGFYLDERGIDVTLDIEIGRERLEKIVSLRSVKVHIHHLNYTLSKSKFSCLAWLLKPLIRPIVRVALEIKIAAVIAQGLHTLNRELVLARERLRATRIANPDDLWTFIRAVAARLTPAPDPDIDARVGVQPGTGVFRGRYAPGSLVKLWEQEGRDASQRVYEYERQGWRNDIFDVKTTTATPAMGATV